MTELHPGADRVDVGILEAGDEQPTGEVDHLGTRADEFPQLVMADSDDPLPHDSDSGRPRASGVAEVDGATDEEQVCIHARFLVHDSPRRARALSLRMSGRARSGRSSSANSASQRSGDRTG